MVVGRPALRSVDSEHAGRVMESRNRLVVGADAVAKAEGNTPSAVMVWHRGPAGVGERGMHAQGFPRNLGDLAVSLEVRRAG